MPETVELAGIPGHVEQPIEPQDLPESFEWHTSERLSSERLDEVADQLETLVDDPKGAPLAFPDRRDRYDVLVDLAEVRREDGGLLAILRRRPGTAAPTRASESGR